MALTAEQVEREFLEGWPQWGPLADALGQAVQAIVQTHYRGGWVMTCGNGGSAADSAHIVGELVKEFRVKRPLTARQRQTLVDRLGPQASSLADRLQQGIRAVALTSGSPAMTAIINDCGHDLVFAQQVYALGKPGDVLIGLSTSGNSANVVQAFRVARALGMTTIGLTGQKPAAMDSLSDCLFKAPATETYRIQEYHLPLYHALCAMVECELFAGDLAK